MSREKVGARVFVVQVCFRLGLAKEFLDYESMFLVKFDFPIVTICACQASDLSSYMVVKKLESFLHIFHIYK